MNRVQVVIDIMKNSSPRYETYCEVGVKQGRMLVGVMSATGCAGIAVDPWKNVPNEGESYDEWDFETIKDEFDLITRPFEDRLRVFQMTSLEAVELIEDRSIDLVFIDAAHDYENMSRDIPAWLPKITPGGIISGHDYDEKFPGVMKAVDELVPTRKLESNAVWWEFASALI